MAVLLASAAVVALAYGARKTLAREALTAWLRRQGVQSEITFSSFDASGATGALRIGPPDHPALVAEVAEVRYDLLGFWSGDPFGARVTYVRLAGPVLHGRLHDGKLSLGALDPLIERLRRQPAQPDRGQPKIEIDGADIVLDTDYGRIEALADLRANDGRLQRMDARLGPTDLKGPAVTGQVAAAELHLVAFQDRLALAGALAAPRLRQGGADLKGVQVRLTGQAPYPDLKARSGAGRIELSLSADAQALSSGGLSLTEVRQTGRFSGALKGWIDDLSVTGSTTASTTARGLKGQGLEATDLRLDAAAPDLTWSRAQADRVTGGVRLDGGARRLTAPGGMIVTGLAVRGDGPISVGRDGWSAVLTGGLSGRGQLPSGSGVRALQDLTLQAPGLRMAAGSARPLTVDLLEPARLSPASGGLIVVQSLGGPAFSGGAGAFRLHASGGDLPQVDLAVDRYALTAGGLRGRARLKASGDMAPVAGGRIEAAGRFEADSQGARFLSDGCALLAADHVELGENDLDAASGRFCPDGAKPLVRVSKGTVALAGRAGEVSGRLKGFDVAVSRASGDLDLAIRPGGMSGVIRVRTARVEDTAASSRFTPVALTGEAQVRGERWTGGFDLADPAGHRLGHADLDADLARAAGRVDLDTGVLTFAQGGLQPAALSPLAATVGSPAVGEARFSGRIAWRAGKLDSGGTLDIAGLDFRSPAGQVTGLKGRVVFDSLVPLRSAPGQVLQADSVSGVAPVTGAQVTFGLDEKSLRVGAARFGLAGGEVTLPAFEIPLKPGASWTAQADFDGVRLGELVAASPFADRMQVNATIAGSIPFAVTPAGLSIVKGGFHAVSPGRLSIRREALTQVAASGGAATAEGAPAGAAPQIDPYSDLAYQALENLAFTELSADVSTLPGGRLGVLFHIKGEHAPPKPQDIRLTWREVITRKVTRALPLPSGTKVDLTLDTSANLDQLLKDFAEFQRLRNSGPVQP